MSQSQSYYNRSRIKLCKKEIAACYSEKSKVKKKEKKIFCVFTLRKARIYTLVVGILMTNKYFRGQYSWHIAYICTAKHKYKLD